MPSPSVAGTGDDGAPAGQVGEGEVVLRVAAWLLL